MQKGEYVECINSSIIKYWDKDGAIQDTLVSKSESWNEKTKKMDKRNASILTVDRIQGDFVSFVGKYFFHPINRFKVLF